MLAIGFKGEHGFDVSRLSADVAQPPPSFSARWRKGRSSSRRQDASVAGEGDAFLLLLLSGDVSVGEWVYVVHPFWLEKAGLELYCEVILTCLILPAAKPCRSMNGVWPSRKIFIQ